MQRKTTKWQNDFWLTSPIYVVGVVNLPVVITTLEFKRYASSKNKSDLNSTNIKKLDIKHKNRKETIAYTQWATLGVTHFIVTNYTSQLHTFQSSASSAQMVQVGKQFRSPVKTGCFGPEIVPKIFFTTAIYPTNSVSNWKNSSN